MIKMIILNNKYYKQYYNLFNYNYNIYNIIYNNLLFFYIYKGDTLCNISYNINYNLNIYLDNAKNASIPDTNSLHNYNVFILSKYVNKSTSRFLIITQIAGWLNKLKLNLINFNTDLFLMYNATNKNYFDKTLFLKKITNIKNIYSSFEYNQFIETIIQLKNNTLKIKKYNIISCHHGYQAGLPLNASYRMIIELPYIISSIGVAFKTLEKGGQLLLFWTVINVHVPSVKKLLTLLCYAFESIKVVNDDINQNFFQGITEYYIVCNSFKNNLSKELINKFLDISLETIDYTYDICDTIDYYKKYSLKHPNQTLFYKNSQKYIVNKLSFKRQTKYKFKSKTISKTISKTKSKTISKTKSKTKSKTISKTISKTKNKTISKTKKENESKTKSKTKKENESKTISKTKKENESKTKKENESKTISKTKKEIKYIEDIDLPGFDVIEQDGDIQYKTMILSNRLEGIFIDCFEKINNMIANQIETVDDGKGNSILQVKPIAIAQRKTNDIKRFVNMLETNNIPYNKHILTIMKDEEDEIIRFFYNLYNPIKSHLIQYNDPISKKLNLNALDNFKLCKPYKLEEIYNTYKNIDLAYKVYIHLLNSLDLNADNIPKSVKHATEDLTQGLAKFISNRNNDKLPIPNIIADIFIFHNTVNFVNKRFYNNPKYLVNRFNQDMIAFINKYNITNEIKNIYNENTYKTSNTSSITSISNKNILYVPETFIINENKYKFPKWYILRPIYSFSGLDIFYINNQKQLDAKKQFYNINKNYTGKLYGNNVIASEYITNPLLFQKKKFHLRIYLLASYINNIFNSFLPNFGKIFTAKYPFDMKEPFTKDKHDTHATTTEKDFFFPKDFKENINANDINIDIDIDSIWEKLKKIVSILARILEKNKKKLLYNNEINGYHLFGIDLMFKINSDDNGNNIVPVFIEMNEGPGFNFKDPKLKEQYSKYIYDLINETVLETIFKDKNSKISKNTDISKNSKNSKINALTIRNHSTYIKPYKSK